MKKLLAFILAVTMIATLIPSAFAAGTDGEETPYDGVKMVYDLKTLLDTIDIEYSANNTIPLTDINYEISNGLFKYVKSVITDNIPTNATNVSVGGILNGGKRFFQFKGGSYICFEVCIPENGKYTLTINRQRIRSGTTNVNVYVTDAEYFYNNTFGISNGMLGDVVGSYSCTDSNVNTTAFNSSNDTFADTIAFENKELTAGRYIITYHAQGTASTGKACLSTFTLSSGTAPKSITDGGESIKYDIQTLMKNKSLHTGKETDIPIAGIGYNDTNDFFDITGKIGTVSYASSSTTPYNFFKLGKSARIAMKIKVPKGGTYALRTSYQQAKDGTSVSICLNDLENEIGSYSCHSDTNENNITAGANSNGYWVNDAMIAENITLSAGEHTLWFTTGSDGLGTVGTFELISGPLGTLTTDMGASIKVSDTELTVGETASVEYAKAYLSDGSVDESKTASNTYTSSDTAVVAVDGTTITAVGAGTADITTTVGGVSAKRTITVVDKAATDEVSTVQFMATSTIANNLGVTTDVDDYIVGGTTSDIVPGKTVKVTANPVDGYIFRGWKRGSKDNGVWLTTSNTYSFPLLTNTYLTAIYDVDTATDAAVNVEFYNYNGQFLASRAVNGAGFGTLASGVTPTLTGYNSFFWTIDGANAIGDDTVFEKLTRVVAKFTDEGRKTFNVTVPANAESNLPDGTYAYDTEIEMTADVDGFWKVNGETVSYGNSYTYTVWSKAEITFEAGENDNKPIISIDDNKTDGARMISYDANGADIIEVGILFGANAKINSANSRAVSREAKTNLKGQFTAKPYSDTDADNATAYLIYNDNGTYRVIYAD